MAHSNKEIILLCGDAGVGKATLFGQLVNRINPQERSDTPSIEHASKEVRYGGQKLILSLFDISGQTSCQPLIATYARHSKCVVLVFDVCNSISFANLEQYLETCKQQMIFNSTPVYFIVGNKIDQKIGRVISEYNGQNFANDHGAHYCEISAKDAQSVNKLEQLILQKISSQEVVVSTKPSSPLKNQILAEKIDQHAKHFQTNPHLKEICQTLFRANQEPEEYNAKAFFIPKMKDLNSNLRNAAFYGSSVLNSVINLTLMVGLISSGAAIPFLYCLGMNYGLALTLIALTLLTGYSLVNKKMTGDAFMFFAFGAKQQTQLLCNEVFCELGTDLRI